MSSSRGSALPVSQPVAVSPRQTPGPRRGALTLLELLIAIGIMVMIAGTLGGVARSVETSSQYAESAGSTAQHARVAIERIRRTVSEAYANENFPGFRVLTETASGCSFPDTLVVWCPRAGSSMGPPTSNPRLGELVVFYPDANRPNELREIRLDETVPQRDWPAGFNTELLPSQDLAAVVAALKRDWASLSRVITPLLYSGSVQPAATPRPRGAVRFHSLEQAPSAEVHQNWLRMELMLLPHAHETWEGMGNEEPVVYFGSATVNWYERP